MTVVSRTLDRLARQASHGEPLLAAGVAIRSLLVEPLAMNLTEVVDGALSAGLARMEGAAATPSRREAHAPALRSPVDISRPVAAPPEPQPDARRRQARSPEPAAQPQSVRRTKPRRTPTPSPIVRVPVPPDMAIAPRRAELPPPAANGAVPAVALGVLTTRTPGGAMAATTPVVLEIQSNPAIGPRTIGPSTMTGEPAAPAPRAESATHVPGVSRVVRTDVPAAASPLVSAPVDEATAIGARQTGTVPPAAVRGGELARLAVWWREHEASTAATIVAPHETNLVEAPASARVPASWPLPDRPEDPLTTDLDGLDSFTRALERVLLREARRHGVEVEEP